MRPLKKGLKETVPITFYIFIFLAFTTILIASKIFPMKLQQGLFKYHYFIIHIAVVFLFT